MTTEQHDQATRLVNLLTELETDIRAVRIAAEALTAALKPVEPPVEPPIEPPIEPPVEPPVKPGSCPALADAAYTKVRLPTKGIGGSFEIAQPANACLDGRDKHYFAMREDSFPSGPASPKEVLDVAFAGRAVITGLRITNLASPAAHWYWYKGGPVYADHDGLRVKTSDELTINRCAFYRVFDPINLIPTSRASAKFVLSTCYFRDILDDVIENDQCCEVKIDDILVDGCFAFYSQRPGNKQPCGNPVKRTIISNSAIELKDIIRATPNARLMHGMFLKLGPNNGPYQISNTVIKIPSPPTNPDGKMDSGGNFTRFTFPTGNSTYSNVIICWTGEAKHGPFLRHVDGGQLPAGVTVVQGDAPFQAMRTAWLRANGDNSGTGDDFPWLHT